MSLWHPNLLTYLHGWFPSLCTIIEKATVTRGPMGGAIKLPPANTAIINVKCALVPLAEDEKVSPSGTRSEATHKVILQGYYPAITSAMEAIVDGAVYNISGCEVDSQHTITCLLINRATN